jgi:hypothetical protein
MAKLKIFSLAVIAMIVLTSFSGVTKPAKPPCWVYGNWVLTTSGIAAASISDSFADDFQLGVPIPGFSGSIDHTGGMIEITTHVGSTHPAGTIVIKHNGSIVHTHALLRNENVVCTQFYTAACGDVFDVTW